MAALIRSATSADIPAMVDLLRELFSIEVDFTPEPAKQQQGLELLLRRGDQACVLVAEQAGRVAGMVTAQVVVSTAEGSEVAWIEDLVITKEFRGQGLGRELLTAVEHWCIERGLKRMQLLADRENSPALEFYRRQGWQTTQMFAWRKYPSET
jgi:ribosomal protein S18 acetylase RimI-like enzyme